MTQQLSVLRHVRRRDGDGSAHRGLWGVAVPGWWWSGWCALGLAAASRWQGCAKELIISRSPPWVHVYNLEEHGRRFFRSLVYSTDGARCLHHLPPVLQASASATSELGAYLVCAGDAATPSSVAARLSSLVIRRNLSGQLGTQTFVPSRLLYGCVSKQLCEAPCVQETW